MEKQNLLLTPTKIMEQVFIQRTLYHQSLVKRNLFVMEGFLNLSKKELKNIAINHDATKFKFPERLGYIWMNWLFFCKKNNLSHNITNEINDIISAAHNHHLKNNTHHPEGHMSPNQMSPLELLEMVCDWTAVNQELQINQGSCYVWAKKNIDVKWRFSIDHKKLIFLMIKELDKRNNIIRRI